MKPSPSRMLLLPAFLLLPAAGVAHAGMPGVEALERVSQAPRRDTQRDVLLRTGARELGEGRVRPCGNLAGEQAPSLSANRPLPRLPPLPDTVRASGLPAQVCDESDGAF